MASVKISRAKQLRQKVVNLMYLVFIVLAFIYVPSDFIDTMKDVNTSLEEANRDIKSMNYFNVRILEAIEKSDTTKQQANDIDYRQVMSLTNNVDRMIEDFKWQLQQDAGGINTAGYIVQGKENYHSDEIFITAKGAQRLRQLLTGYKERIRELTGLSSVITPFDSIVKTNQYVFTSSGQAKKWENFYFYKVPATITLTMLSKFQSDIRQIEYLVISSYLEELTNEYDITLQPKDREEKKQRLVPEEPPRPIMDPRANIQSADFVILYTDIDNPLKVHHPVYLNTELVGKIQDGNIFLKDSVFYVRVTRPGITEVSIYHSMDSINPIVKQKFLVKAMPEPIALLLDRQGGIISSKIFGLQNELKVKSDMERFSVEYLVKRFTLMRVHKDGSPVEKSEKNPGGNFNVSTRQIVNEAQRGDIYIFDEIEAKTPEGTIVNIKAIVFTII